MNLPEFYTLQHCDTVTIENATMPYMRSLYSCLNGIKGDGYTEDFEKNTHGIHSVSTRHNYLPKEFKITNFFRFEGNEKSGDNVVMYLIETTDGLKGTLINSYDLAQERKSSTAVNYDLH